MEAGPSIPVQVAWLVVVDLAAFGLGSRLYRAFLLEPADESPLRELCFSVVLGFLAWGAIFVLLASAGVLHRSLVVAAVGLLAVAGCVQLRATLTTQWFRPARLRALASEGLSACIRNPLMALSGALLLAFLPRCFGPEVAFDSLSYHLALPDRYLREHGFVTILPSLAANMPHFMDLLQVLSLSGGGIVTAKLFVLQWNVLVLCGFAIFFRGAPPGTPATSGAPADLAGLAGLIYLGAPIVQMHLGITYVEPALACLFLFGALALREWLGGRPRSWLLASGLLLGFAMSFKYTAWLFAVGPLLAIAAVVLGRTQLPWPERIHALLLVGICVALPVLPWAIKSFVATGNPVYPNLTGLFGEFWWSELQHQQYLHEIRRIGFEEGERTLVEHLKLPLRLAFPGPEVYRADPSVSVVLVAAALAAPLLRSSYRRGAWVLLLMIYPGLILWAAGDIRVARYLVALLPLLSIVAVVSLRPLLARRAGFVGTAALVLLALAVQIDLPTEAWRSRDVANAESIAREKNLIGLWEKVHETLPEDARLALFFENRILFLKRPAMIDPIFEAPAGSAMLRSAGSPDDMASFLRDRGITHLIVNSAAEKRYFRRGAVLPHDRFPQETRDYRCFFSRHTEPVFRRGRYAAFALLSAPRASRRGEVDPCAS